MNVNCPPYALLTCDVFEDEVRLLGGENPPWVKYFCFEMGLHDRPDELRITIQRTIDELETDLNISHIVLAYGLCGNGLLGVKARSKSIIIPKAHDCISIMLGGMQRHQAYLKASPQSYFYSPGWIRGKRVPGPDREGELRKMFAEKYEDDPEMMDEMIEADRETFDHYSCAAYVDLTDNPEAESYCKTCAKSMGWRFERLPADQSILSDLLHADWDKERFLMLNPGQAIAINSNGHMIAQ